MYFSGFGAELPRLISRDEFSRYLCRLVVLVAQGLPVIGRIISRHQSINDATHVRLNFAAVSHAADHHASPVRQLVPLGLSRIACGPSGGHGQGIEPASRSYRCLSLGELPGRGIISMARANYRRQL